MTHVTTVICPECGRKWTGEFNDGAQEKAVCIDCIREGRGKVEDSPDIHINPKGRLHVE